MTAWQIKARYNKTKQKSSYQGWIQQSNRRKRAVEAGKSQRCTCPYCWNSHRHSKLTAITYKQKTFYRSMQAPHLTFQSLWVRVRPAWLTQRARVSWCLLWLLQYFLPIFYRFLDLGGEGPNGDLQFRFPLSIMPGSGSLYPLSSAARRSLSY